MDVENGEEEENFTAGKVEEKVTVDGLSSLGQPSVLDVAMLGVQDLPIMQGQDEVTKESEKILILKEGEPISIGCYHSSSNYS
ncbi:hypothetical protein FRX31_017544 [Thalictrum thalictroides]|uniref:Uncharacterized protein n=1 Tax=Thalictrum thalictroides TaxID=46969 RepID=A0A7J6W658_THATH|nr:hypothetical protein FRX31_017544 [Thalictrum thalictroides]